MFTPQLTITRVADAITFYQHEEHLIIVIGFTWPNEMPTATILNYSGETVVRFELKPGSNNINIAAYHSGNYSIRISNGKNVIVQKI